MLFVPHLICMNSSVLLLMSALFTLPVKAPAMEDGEAVQPEKGSGVGLPQDLPQRFSFCELIDQFV
jgi:hypothetical protein